MFNYNHLYYFYITAKSDGVTKAAKHLNISQPSLSSQLKVLEAQLNVKLFQKVGRVNQLTKAGSVAYGFCRQMFEVSEQMSETILQRLPSVTRRIHIGVSDEVERSFVVEVVSHFLKEQKVTERPKVTIVAGTQEQLAERLKFRELDVIITELAITDPELMNLSRIEVPVVLACPIRWTLKSKLRNINATAAIAEIVGGNISEWVVPSTKFKLRAEIDQFFENNELKGRRVIESDMIASLVRAVSDGIGMGFFPLLYIAKELRGKTVRLLGPKKGYWKYRVWLVCSHQSHSDVLIKSFSDSFKVVSENSL
jgi:LysR family transcriptional regulator, transcriptional activator of nhaA